MANIWFHSTVASSLPSCLQEQILAQTPQDDVLGQQMKTEQMLKDLCSTELSIQQSHITLSYISGSTWSEEREKLAMQ